MRSTIESGAVSAKQLSERWVAPEVADQPLSVIFEGLRF
jgi:hypothetical protein